jgi:hypothetical protein
MVIFRLWVERVANLSQLRGFVKPVVEILEQRNYGTENHNPKNSPPSLFEPFRQAQGPEPVERAMEDMAIPKNPKNDRWPGDAPGLEILLFRLFGVWKLAFVILAHRSAQVRLSAKIQPPDFLRPALPSIPKPPAH